MAKKFNYPDKASLSRMTNVDAQAIMQYVAELEFPKLYEMSVQFALFKVLPWAIPYKVITESMLDVRHSNHFWIALCYQRVFYA